MAEPRTAPLGLVPVRDLLVAELQADVRDVRPVPHGHWSRAYTFATPDGAYVVRFTHWPLDLFKDRLVESRAADTLPLAATTKVGVAGDLWFAISRRLPGTHLDDLDAPAARRSLPAVCGLLDAMSSVDLAGTSGFGCWTADEVAPHVSWAGYLVDVAEDACDGRLQGWRTSLSRSSRGLGDFCRCVLALERSLPAPDVHRGLVHGDLLSRNVLVSGPRITGVVDWGWSLYGDPLYDVARLAFWAPSFPALQGAGLVEHLRRHATRGGADTRDVERRLRCYGIHVGLVGQKHAAFRQDPERLASVTERTLALAGTAAGRC